MGNILPKRKASELTYALPTKMVEYSYEDAKEQVPCLHVKTNGHTIKKDDHYLYVDKEKIDLTQKNIRELCVDLLERDVFVSCIEYPQLLELPAIFLSDLLSTEYHQGTVRTNPLNLENYNNPVLKGLISIKSEVTPLYCGNTLTKERLVTTFENNRLFVKGTIDAYSIFCYSITTTEFIWYVDYKHIVTSSKEFVSKSMGEVK